MIQARSRGLSKDREASEVRIDRRVLCVGLRQSSNQEPRRVAGLLPGQEEPGQM